MQVAKQRKIGVMQAAVIIGVSGARVQQLVKTGELKAERIRFGKSVRVLLSEDDVLEYKARRDEFLAVPA
jgi:excisionase family DNA binding protein